MKAGILASLAILPALAAGVMAATPAPAPVRLPDVAPLPLPASAVTWQIDPTHSELTFRIRHLVSHVRGRFNDWKGTVVADPADLTGGNVQVEIQTGSIDTNNQRRDAHLRTDDFFAAEQHPTITFRSTRVETRGKDLTVHGDLTIRGTTRPVVLEGRMTDMIGAPGKRRIGFEAETTIDRTDFGVSWNRAAEAGGMTLGDQVTITIAIAAAEQAPS